MGTKVKSGVISSSAVETLPTSANFTGTDFKSLGNGSTAQVTVASGYKPQIGDYLLLIEEETVHKVTNTVFLPNNLVHIQLDPKMPTGVDEEDTTDEIKVVKSENGYFTSVGLEIVGEGVEVNGASKKESFSLTANGEQYGRTLETVVVVTDADSSVNWTATKW